MYEKSGQAEEMKFYKRKKEWEHPWRHRFIEKHESNDGR